MSPVIYIDINIDDCTSVMCWDSNTNNLSPLSYLTASSIYNVHNTGTHLLQF